MAETDCRSQLHACAIRVALLTATGAPSVGAGNLYVSDALVALTFTPVYTDGEETEDKNACGAVKTAYKAPDNFKRGDVSIELVTPDPFLSAWLGGGAVIPAQAAVVGPPAVAAVPAGAQAPPIGQVVGNGVSIELWTKRIEDGDLDAVHPYAHWAYTKVKNLRIAPHTHGNAPLHATFVGQAYENLQWGNGPNNDFTVASDRVYQWVPALTIPAATCALGAVLA